MAPNTTIYARSGDCPSPEEVRSGLRLIGLCAEGTSSGKTEVARILKENADAVCVKFADPLKALIAYFIEWSGVPPADSQRYVDGDLKEEIVPGLGVRARSLLQTFGTDWARGMVSEDVWVRIAAHRIRYFLSGGYVVVIDDVRFPNEVDAIRAMGGVVVRVSRPGAAASEADHVAERSLADLTPDATIINDGTLKDLSFKVHKALQELAND